MPSTLRLCPTVPSFRRRGSRRAWAPAAAALLTLATTSACSPTGDPSPAQAERDRAADAAKDRPEGSTPSDTKPQSQTAHDAAGEPTAPSAWEVHEWGVITVDGSNLSRGKFVGGPAASNPKPDVTPTRPIAKKRKPVLYVHLGKGVQEASFTVTVTPPAGRVVEHWPDTTADTGSTPSITWRDVRATTTACDGKRFEYPAADAPACATPDGTCEVSELASVETEDGACLEFSGKTYEHLFYRGELDALPLGLTLERTPSGTFRVSNTGQGVIRGAMRVTTHGSRPNTTLDVLAEIPAGGHADLGAEAVGKDVAAGVTALKAELERQGLTTPEADAFLRAWSSDLFGVDPTDPNAPPNSAVLVGGGLPTKSDLLLVWLDRETVDAILPLTFSPEPTRLERAHLLVIELPPF